jgi:hypothetical protein
MDFGVAAIDVPGADARCWTHGTTQRDSENTIHRIG